VRLTDTRNEESYIALRGKKKSHASGWNSPLDGVECEPRLSCDYLRTKQRMQLCSRMLCYGSVIKVHLLDVLEGLYID